MYCEKCGAKLPHGAKFCPECGAELSGATRSILGSAPGPLSGGLPPRGWIYLPGALAEYLGARIGRHARVALCVLISLMLLATNWLVATGETGRALRSLGEDPAALAAEAAEIGGLLGIELDGGALERIAAQLGDARIAPYEAFRIGEDAIPMLRELEGFLVRAGEPTRALSAASFAIRLYALLFLSSVALGCATLIAQIMGWRPRVERLFFAAQLALFAAFVGASLFAGSRGLHLRPGLTAAASVAFALLAGMGERGARD